MIEVMKRVDELPTGNLLRDIWLDSDGDVIFFDSEKRSWVYLWLNVHGVEPLEVQLGAETAPYFRLKKGPRP